MYNPAIPLRERLLVYSLRAGLVSSGLIKVYIRRGLDEFVTRRRSSHLKYVAAIDLH